MAKKGKRVQLDGYTFLSTTEADFYKKLKKAKKKGLIKDFKVAAGYVVLNEYTNWRGKKVGAIMHYPDFMIYRLDGTRYIVDTKGGGFHEKDAIIKHKMWMKRNKRIPYFFVSVTPKYIDNGIWVESTPRTNLFSGFQKVYGKVFPEVTNKRLKSTPILTQAILKRYYNYILIDGLFYMWIKKYTPTEVKNMKEERAVETATEIGIENDTSPTFNEKHGEIKVEGGNQLEDDE